MQVLRFDQLVNRSPQIEELCRCMICLEIFIDPICCENCENHFCQTCITTWSQNQPPRSCPICNKLKEKQGQRILKNMLNDLNVYCCYKQNGCLGILKYSDYFSHIKSCEYKMIKCECDGCNLDILVKDKYQHELICPFKLIKCRWCKIDTIRKNLQIHETNECQQRCINCKLCQIEVSALKMGEHLLHCPENSVLIFNIQFICRWCQKDIKIKLKAVHEQNDCPSILIQCLGCQQSFQRVELNAHIQQCQFVEIECDNCQMLVQRQNLKDHNIAKCFRNLKTTIVDQQRQIKGLITFCEELSQQMNLLQLKQSPKFSKTNKHQDIHLKNEGKVAFILSQDEKVEDRLVEIKNSKNKPLLLEFMSLIDNSVYIGIVSNQCDSSLLFSGSGQVYFNKYKTEQENSKQKNFGFVVGQKLELLWNDVYVSVTNLNTKQNLKYNIPQNLVEDDEVEFHVVICLRQGSDRVRILN